MTHIRDPPTFKGHQESRYCNVTTASCGSALLFIDSTFSIKMATKFAKTYSFTDKPVKQTKDNVGKLGFCEYLYFVHHQVKCCDLH